MREALGHRSIEQIHFDPERTYIGRWQNAPFGNPFVVGQDGTREEVIEMYFAHLLGSPQLQERIASELHDQILVCHCREDEKCHGDVIEAFLKSRMSKTKSPSKGHQAPIQPERSL